MLLITSSKPMSSNWVRETGVIREMRRFHNRNLKEHLSLPFIFNSFALQPKSWKGYDCSLQTFHWSKCQGWSAILIQEFISLCIWRSPWDCAAWEQTRLSAGNISCTHLRGTVLLTERPNFYSKSKVRRQLTLLESHACDMTSMEGNGLPQASAVETEIRIPPMRTSNTLLFLPSKTWMFPHELGCRQN